MKNENEKIILHCDLNNFYASVECLSHPEWKNVAMAVSGNPEMRHGIILAKNEVAKKLGVKTGETIWQARQKAPDLICVPPHHELYAKYSKLAFKIYNDFTPYVEPFGPDECWLDVTGCVKLFGDGEEIANKLRKKIRDTLGLTISVGVSFNKVFAKLGSDLKKPDATTVITRENFKQKIWGLKCSEMLGIGSKTAEKLKKMNVATIGDLANTDVNVLKNHFGIIGVRIREYANGICHEPVREAVVSRDVDSVGHGMTTTHDVTTIDEATNLITFLADKVAIRLRKKFLRGSGVSLTLRYSDLTFLTRQKHLNYSTCSAFDIVKESLALLKANWDMRPLRTVTVSVFALNERGGNQLDMLGENIKRVKNEKLERSIDAINKKYGHGKVSRAFIGATDFIYDHDDDEIMLPFCREHDAKELFNDD